MLVFKSLQTQKKTKVSKGSATYYQYILLIYFNSYSTIKTNLKTNIIRVTKALGVAVIGNMLMDNPNLTFPPQSLSSWQNYYDTFPKDLNGKGLSGPTMYEIVMGVLKALRDSVLNDLSPNRCLGITVNIYTLITKYLKFMTKIKLIISIISFLLIYSCSINERPQFRYRSDRKQKNNEKEFYTKRFRDAVFYKCLQHGYGEDTNFKIGKLMAEKDLFTPSDEPFIIEDRIQDSLAKQIISKLPPVYMLSENENEIKGKNFIISTCLSFYESKELNTIAHKYYKMKLKEERN